MAGNSLALVVSTITDTAFTAMVLLTLRHRDLSIALLRNHTLRSLQAKTHLRQKAGSHLLLLHRAFH